MISSIGKHSIDNTQNYCRWDHPGVLGDKAMVEASLNCAHHRSSLVAASSQHSGDWLFALPIASCGLRLDDEVVRVAVGLWLGLDLCIPHHCPCAMSWSKVCSWLKCSTWTGCWCCRTLRSTWKEPRHWEFSAIKLKTNQPLWLEKVLLRYVAVYFL